MEYVISDELEADIDNRMTYHAPKEGQPEKYQEIRSNAKSLMILAARLVPPGPERDKAFEKIEEFCFWANAGVARRE